MPNLNGPILTYCHKAVVETIKKPLPLSEGELDLEALFDRELGRRKWPQVIKRKVKAVYKTVTTDVRQGRVDPLTSDNPVRFIVNSVAIHVLEQMLVKADVASSLQELREGLYHEALHNQVTSLDLS